MAGTVLKKGQRFTLDGTSYRVAYVTASRAHCISVSRQPITIGGRTFLATSARSLDLSPNACPDLCADILRTLTKEP
jgi:hypothetical protein